jgi:aminoglycoside 6'-N-acetyltransferase
VQWWGDPSEQYDLVSGDLAEPAMDQFIVSAGSSDFAYLQCYDLTAWNSALANTRAAPAASTSSSANPAMIERGHGSAFIRTFVDARLRKGRRASSPIPIRPTPGRSRYRKQALKKLVWSIHLMAPLY